MIKNLPKAFSLVEILGVVSVTMTLATVSIISLKDSVAAGQKAAMQRELQTLNTALQNFKSAGGTILDNANVNDAVRELQYGTGIEGSTFVPLTSDPPRTFDVAGVPHNLEYDPEEGFSYQADDDSGMTGAGTAVVSSPQSQPFTWTDEGIADALSYLEGLDSTDPEYTQYMDNLALAMNMDELSENTISDISDVMARQGYIFNPDTLSWDSLVDNFNAFATPGEQDTYFDGLTSVQQAFIYPTLPASTQDRVLTMLMPTLKNREQYRTEQASLVAFLNSLSPGQAGQALNYLDDRTGSGLPYGSDVFVGTVSPYASPDGSSTSSTKIDGLNLSGLNLSGFNPGNKSIAGVSFANSNITPSQLNTSLNFTGVNFSGVSLSGLNMRLTSTGGGARSMLNANLSGANLSGIDFSANNSAGSGGGSGPFSNTNLTGARIDLNTKPPFPPRTADSQSIPNLPTNLDSSGNGVWFGKTVVNWVIQPGGNNIVRTGWTTWTWQ